LRHLAFDAVITHVDNSSIKLILLVLGASWPILISS
jgi:hypothetical protein